MRVYFVVADDDSNNRRKFLRMCGKKVGFYGYYAANEYIPLSLQSLLCADMIGLVALAFRVFAAIFGQIDTNTNTHLCCYC